MSGVFLHSKSPATTKLGRGFRGAHPGPSGAHVVSSRPVGPLFLRSSRKVLPTVYTKDTFKILLCILEISLLVEGNEWLLPLRKCIFKRGYNLGRGRAPLGSLTTISSESSARRRLAESKRTPSLLPSTPKQRGGRV